MADDDPADAKDDARTLADHSIDETPASREIGRYVVIGVAGRGGMGQVLRAYDPRLRREVAIKLLFAVDADARARAIREAQAMATLSHPNIVAVYDADEHEGRPFIAMEFVEGETLDQWLVKPRSWRDVLAILALAAQGLAAAHAAGIVHRDFKPSNVIIGKGDRVRVTDFGIARRSGEGATDGAGDSGPVDDALTRRGVITGTPPYLAPELADGEPATPRSDLYSFAVTMWEALYGKRPFSGTMVAMFAAKSRHELPHVGERGVPSWLHRVLVRALSPSPTDRPADMPALLAELRHDSDRSQRLRIAGVGLALAATVGGVVGVRAWVEHERSESCIEDGAKIELLWNDEARGDLETAIANSGAIDAPAIAARAIPWIDAFAERWRETRTQICMAREIELTLGPEDHASAMWCLEERHVALETWLAELARPEPEAAYRSIAAAAALPSPTECSTPSPHHARPPDDLPPERVREVNATIARARALSDSGKSSEGLDLARTAVTDATALGWRPLVASAQLLVCGLEDYVGNLAPAHAACEAAFHDAARMDRADIMADAANRLIGIAIDLGRLDEAKQWGMHAEVAIGRLVDHGELRTMRLLEYRGAVAFHAGDYARARDLHEQALAIAERSLGAAHPTVGTSLDNLAMDAEALGDREAALAIYQRAADTTVQALGPEHPHVATALGNVADLAFEGGDLDAALTMYERSLAIDERAYGPDHPAVAGMLRRIAAVHAARGENERARNEYDRALAMLERALGPKHDELVPVLAGIATVANTEGRHVDALPVAERAVRIATDGKPSARSACAARLALSRALVGSAGDRPRARELATTAVDACRADVKGSPRNLADAEAWLASLDAG